jgi:hypothetical protein
MNPDSIDRERWDRLATDLELLGRIGDPSRGPLARYYLPAQPQVEAVSRPEKPVVLLRRSLCAAVAIFHRLYMNRPQIAWSPLNERRPVEPRL